MLARSAARGLPRGCSRWLCAFLVLVAFTTGASGHAALVRAVPWDGAVVREAPSALTLTFNEPISPLIIRLIGPDGKPIALRDVAVENATISIPAPPLQRGSYVLSWRVISADGHPVGGSVVFSVGAPSRSSLPETQQSASSSVIAGLWTARFVIYIGLFVGIGGAVFAAWISHDRLCSTPAMQAAFLAVLAGGLLAASGAIGLQGMDALDLPLSAWREKVVWETGFKTSYGLTAVTAACALLLAGFSFFPSSQRKARALSVAALLGAAIALSLSGHASTASPGLVSCPALLLHVACAIFWIGSLAAALDEPACRKGGSFVPGSVFAGDPGAGRSCRGKRERARSGSDRWNQFVMGHELWAGAAVQARAWWRCCSLLLGLIVTGWYRSSASMVALPFGD